MTSKDQYLLKKAKNDYEILYYYFFDMETLEPPQELLDSKRITHKTLITTFLMSPKLTSYLSSRIVRYNFYTIDKKSLLKRLKQLIQKLGISRYEFWTITQKRHEQDPLAKELWQRYMIRPQDLDYVIDVVGSREKLEILLGKIKKVTKKTKDLFDTLSETVKSKIQQRLESYKQKIESILQTKTTNNPLNEGCRNCPLRNQPYVPPDFIIGDPNRDEVDILIIGMNPYKDEIKHNKPFVGQSGKYLRSMLKEHFPNCNIVITNSAMCFIPNNGDPDQTTLNCCKPLLDQQICMLKPKVIMPLGSLATMNLLGNQVSITKVAGKPFEFEVQDECI